MDWNQEKKMKIPWPTHIVEFMILNFCFFNPFQANFLSLYLPTPRKHLMSS